MIKWQQVPAIIAVAIVLGFCISFSRFMAQRAAEAKDIRNAMNHCESHFARLAEEKRLRDSYPMQLSAVGLSEADADGREAFARLAGEYHGYRDYFVFRMHSRYSFFDRVHEFNSSYPRWIVADGK